MTLASYISQGQQLFGRIFSITISNNTGTAQVWGNEKQGQSPLRVKFTVERSAVGVGDAKIALYNLNTKSRNALKVGSMLVLRAGYTGSMSQVFAGKAKKTITKREGPDIITECECTDGLNFTHYAIWHQSYSAGTPLYRVFEDLATAMLLDISNEQIATAHGAVSGIPNESLNRGLVVHGPVSKTLTELCRARGLCWSIVNQQLRIRPKQHYNSASIAVITRESGLINVPAQNGGLTTFDTLIIPGIYPGTLVQLYCANQDLNGNYLVGKTKTDGDTHAEAWNINVEAVPYKGSILTLPLNTGNNFATAVVP